MAHPLFTCRITLERLRESDDQHQRKEYFQDRPALADWLEEYLL